MAQMSTQVEYRFHDEGHWFFGRDRLSNGVLVGNKDFKVALAEVKRQLKNAVKMSDVEGVPVCTLSDEDLEKQVIPMGRAMTLWTMDEFGR